MIDRITGLVVGTGIDHVSVDLGPVALRATVPPHVAAECRAGSTIELHTVLVVREDGWTLYGFADTDHCRMFEQVQTVTGIGPRIAMGLVSVLGPEELRRAINADDLAALTQVPGIGKKGAQRIVLELKDRIDLPGTPAITSTQDQSWRVAVSAGLTSLGWTVKEADAAVEALAPRIGDLTDSDDPNVGALLKEALRSLDRS